MKTQNWLFVQKSLHFTTNLQTLNKKNSYFNQELFTKTTSNKLIVNSAQNQN